MHIDKTIFEQLSNDDWKALRAVAYFQKNNHPITPDLYTRAAPLLALGLVQNIDGLLHVPNDTMFAALAFGEPL